MKILAKILKEKEEEIGWAQWEDICKDFEINEELIHNLLDSNLIVQRFGWGNQVKLKDALLEQLILKNE